MIQDLKKFAKELKVFRTQGGLPQGDVKRELANIYEANWNPRWGAEKINLGCPGCVRDMMKSLCAEWEKLQVEHKFPKVEPVTVLNHVDRPPFEMMKWGELRKYATEKGINVKGKKKADILAELKEL